MLIELTTEFKSSWPGPPVCTSTPITVYFHDKAKICKEYLRADYFIIFYQNIAGGNVTYFPISGPNHSQNLTPKSKILNVFWT